MKAEADGASAFKRKKSKTSQQVLDEPWETRYDKRREAGSFRIRDKSLPGFLTKEEIWEETFSMAVLNVSDTKHTVVNLPQLVDILSLYHKEVFQMNTKFTDDEWLLIFQQRTQSGLSVRKWCDSNQISYDKYKYWEKKLLRRSDPERAVSPMDFVELPQALLPPLSLEQEQSYPFELSFHGLHLKIASHAQLSQLAGILKILQASC